MISLRRPRVARTAALCLGLAAIARPAGAQSRVPDALSDREFWRLFTTISEDGGTFPSENFVSNEKTYQFVIPTLQRTLTPGGVYLGVGPEQNFTYIANLQPRLAVIFDIRRQNAILHLMYKALFELSPTRADFVTKLFARPLSPSLPSTAPAAELFAEVAAAAPNDSIYNATWKAIVARLTMDHGFALSESDVASMRHVYSAFFEAGPEISYSYRLGAPPAATPWLVTYAQLQTATNADSVNMSFLATETSYRRLRAIQQRNLVVPIVADFAGSKAVRGVGEYLRARNMFVTTFYTSNVEQYLFGNFGAEKRFYENVLTLPIDSTSTFIRSLPGPPNAPGANGGTIFIGGATFAIRVADSNGVRVVRPLTLDTSVVNAAVRSNALAPQLLTTSGAFTSGISSMARTLEAFSTGDLRAYSQLTALTKTDGWNQPR
jgi:hypothetical protein